MLDFTEKRWRNYVLSFTDNPENISDKEMTPWLKKQIGGGKESVLMISGSLKNGKYARFEAG